MISIPHLLQISFINLILAPINLISSTSFSCFTTITLINSLVAIIKPIHLASLQFYYLKYPLLFTLFLLIYYLIIHQPISLQYPFLNYSH